MRWHRWSTCRVAMKKKRPWRLAGIQKGILALHKMRAAWMHVYSPLLEAHTMVSRQPSAGCRRDTQSLHVVAEQRACVYILAAAQAASAQRVGWHSMIRLQWIPVSNSFMQEQSWLKGAMLVVARRGANFHHLAVFLSVAAIQIIAQANDRQHTVLSRSQGRQKGQNQTAEHQQLCSWHVDWAHLGRCQGAKVTSVNHEEYKIYIIVNIPAWFRFTACHSQKKNSDRTARNHNCKLVVCRFNLKLTCTYSTFRHNRETNRLSQSQGESNYPYHVAFAASGSIVQVQMQWLSAYASSCSVLCLFVAAVE